MTDQRKADASLDIQLDSYTETSNPGLKSAGRNWQVYAAATGAALAAATVAAAGTIYGSSVPIVAGPVSRGVGSFNAAQNVNIGSGQLQLRVHYNAFSSSGWMYGFGNVAVQAYGGLRLFENGSFLQNFASGAPISGPSSALGANPLLFKAGVFTGAQGNFGNHATGFAGFQLNNGDLGWIKLRWDSGDSLPSTLTALSWAYNADGGPMNAGEVPEPGTASLALLATGAAGLLAWRRRRRNPASQG
jgi:hypothetical protein